MIEPKLTIELGTPEEGVIAEVTVDRGDLVAAGEVVAQLESELQRLMIELVRLRAESNIETRSGRARLDLRRTGVARMEALHRKDIVPAKSYDEAVLEERLAELAVEAADLEHRMAQVELEEASERLDRRMIRSPVDGVVAEVMLAPGEYAHEQAPLMVIARIDPLHVEVFVPVRHYGEIAVGTPAEVTIEAPLGGAHAARVMVVDRVFDGASSTFGVRLELPNLEYLIPAGLRCRVRFLPDPWPEVASLLTDADLLLGEAGPPADNGRTVAAGARAGNAEEAAAAAEAGERVRRAQELLRRTGFDPGPADGAWGPKTGEAVREFQTWYPRRGLEPTGRLNDVTYAALRSAAEIGLRRDQSDHHE